MEIIEYEREKQAPITFGDLENDEWFMLAKEVDDDESGLSNSYLLLKQPLQDAQKHGDFNALNFNTDYSASEIYQLFSDDTEVYRVIVKNIEVQIEW